MQEDVRYPFWLQLVVLGSLVVILMSLVICLLSKMIGPEPEPDPHVQQPGGIVVSVSPEQIGVDPTQTPEQVSTNPTLVSEAVEPLPVPWDPRGQLQRLRGSCRIVRDVPELLDVCYREAAALSFLEKIGPLGVDGNTLVRHYDIHVLARGRDGGNLVPDFVQHFIVDNQSLQHFRKSTAGFAGTDHAHVERRKRPRMSGQSIGKAGSLDDLIPEVGDNSVAGFAGLVV